MVAISPFLEETRDALAGEWRRRAPSTPEEIAAFYQDSTELGRDLDAWHATPERQEWTRTIVAVAAANGVESVLDVGAGGGHDLRAILEAIPAVDAAAVEPNADLRRLIWASGIKAVSAIEDIKDVEAVRPSMVDLVICIDVLEHVPDPEDLLAQVMDCVKMGGLLIEASATFDQSTPLHLPEIEGWEPTGSLKAAGFRPVETAGRLAIWQRQQIVETASILVCAHREIAAPTVECLLALNEFGWPTSIIHGDALIDRARAKAVSQWYRANETDVFLMIDDDIVFHSEDAARVVRLAREKRSIACGAYPVGDGGHMASRGWPGQEMHFGPEHKPVEIRWAATGFMAVHRDVVTALIEDMPLCYEGQPDAFWPMFQPFPLRERPGMETAPDYLSEDYAFCQRALELGFPAWLDPRVILVHLKVQALSVWNMKGANR